MQSAVYQVIWGRQTVKNNAKCNQCQYTTNLADFKYNFNCSKKH